MGYDTVAANLMLGHKADERDYKIAGAILRDLGLGSHSSDPNSEGVRVLTNNPDKVEALAKEGIRVVERVAMIPLSWQHRKTEADRKQLVPNVLVHQGSGATLGAHAVYGDDLDKYLRTKVLRMGHMLPLWMEEHDVRIY
jgi:GTP cyclohydrolase II